LSLRELVNEPFKLLLEMERLAKAAVASRQGGASEVEEWIGIGFRVGAESFVAARADVREVLPFPEQMTRIPGAKPWLRGIANIRGQLLTIVDLKAFLGGGRTQTDRQVRILHLASRELPTAVIVDEVLGFRRFAQDDYRKTPPATVIRCEQYLDGGYRRGSESWPLFNLRRLLEDENFSSAGEQQDTG
jgi:twitching motility protein PilI